jgi:hypothetical protein
VWLMLSGICARAVRVTRNADGAGAVVSRLPPSLSRFHCYSLPRLCGIKPISATPTSSVYVSIGPWKKMIPWCVVPLGYCHGVVVSTFGVSFACHASPSLVRVSSSVSLHLLFLGSQGWPLEGIGADWLGATIWHGVR